MQASSNNGRKQAGDDEDDVTIAESWWMRAALDYRGIVKETPMLNRRRLSAGDDDTTL